MSVTLTTGSTINIGSAYGATKTMSAISNASSAVATLEASHGFIVGDKIEIVTSGWARAQRRVFRISAVATNDVTLEGFDTQDTTQFSAGTGAGTVREVTAWTQITQIQNVQSSGGDLNFADITTLDDNEQKQIPTTRGAVQYNLTCLDDPSLSWYSVVNAADAARSPYALYISFPNGSVVFASGYWTIGRTPSMSANSPLTIPVGISLAAQPTRYAG